MQRVARTAEVSNKMADADCPLCGGTGWKIVERAGLSGAERCTCGSASRTRNARENSNIPPNYRHASFDTFQRGADNPIEQRDLGGVMLAVKAFVREYPTEQPCGLLLVGEPGTGKTHLAVAALKALIEKGHEGVFFDYKNLLDRIRSGYDASSGASDREAYRSALDTEILLLDDLGAHRITDWVEDTVTSIITYRCNHRKTLIATTNLTDPDITGSKIAYTDAGRVGVNKRTMGEMIGLRARSRLFEMCRVVKMGAVADYRLKHAK